MGGGCREPRRFLVWVFLASEIGDTVTPPELFLDGHEGGRTITASFARTCTGGRSRAFWVGVPGLPGWGLAWSQPSEMVAPLELFRKMVAEMVSPTRFI